ncbi:MAG: hypothetical protein ACOC38_01735 [Promethearchaeia archaeon]
MTIGKGKQNRGRDTIPMNVQKALVQPGTASRFDGNIGQGKGGTQKLQAVETTLRNRLSRASLSKGRKIK